MEKFSYNEKVGLGLFFNKLKQMGVLDQYMENYMKYHGLSSPSRIPRSIHNILFNDIRGRLYESPMTPMEWLKVFVDNFGAFFVTFNWQYTKEGYDYWYKISNRLERIKI